MSAGQARLFCRLSRQTNQLRTYSIPNNCQIFAAAIAQPETLVKRLQNAQPGFFQFRDGSKHKDFTLVEIAELIRTFGIGALGQHSAPGSVTPESYVGRARAVVIADTIRGDIRHPCRKGEGVIVIAFARSFTIAGGKLLFDHFQRKDFRQKNMEQICCAALLFDLDGVLINSTPAVARVWRRWALERGFNPEEVVSRAHGRPSLTTVREYLPDANHELENQEVERREIEDIEGVIPLPGALELLRSLPENRWTIVTSCTRALAEVRIRAAGLPLPRKMITSNDIVHGKPNPEPFSKGASILGFPAQECVVLEDVPAGVRAGKAAGAKVIAFTTTVQEGALRTVGADWILNSCAEVRLLHAGDKLGLSLLTGTE